MMKNNLINLAEGIITTASKKGVTVSSAESCTGGLIGYSLTDISGSSTVFIGGAITYSEKSKHLILGVPTDTFEDTGVYSHRCAQEMARGIQEKLGSDFAVSTTGIAGPLGGYPDKPVGSVWIGVADATRVASIECHFSGSRADIREAASIQALEIMLRCIEEGFLNCENFAYYT